jgi:hypothetical protein
VLREIAQLRGAVHSPVATEEYQQHSLAAL